MVSFADRALRYARAVLAGDRIAGKWVKGACRRFLDDLERTDWPFELDHAEASRACEFMERLPHVKGDWAKPQFLAGELRYPCLVLEDWEVFILVNLFAWRDRNTGLRRFRRAYIEVARKNAKSTLAAGIGLYMLAADEEEGAEVYAAATKKDQAKILWEVARQMVMRQPEFRQLGVGYTKTSIFVEDTGSKFLPLGRDSDTQDGLNTHCFISDELHAQKDRGLYDVLDSSTGARAQPLGIGITTAGSNRAGVCYEQRKYLSALLNDVLHRHEGLGYALRGKRHEDERYFGVIYTLDTSQDYGEGREGDDWADPAVWAKANPNLGISVMLEDMHAACTKAKASTASQNEFRTKRCNEWVNADQSWMDMARWEQCGDPKLKAERFRGANVCVGLDAAFKTDVFAKIKVIKEGDDYYAFGEYFMPQSQVEKEGNEHFAAWAEDGLIRVSEGQVVDIEQVRDGIHADSELHALEEVAFDPAQLTQFASEMIDEGYTMVELRPTVLNFSETMKFLDEIVRTGRFHHDGDPVLEWMVSNVVCHTDAKDNIYPRKEAPENKIDGVVGLIMALARARVHESGSFEDFVNNAIVA